MNRSTYHCVIVNKNIDQSKYERIKTGEKKKKKI
jgi:hypothetical protein